MSLMISQATSSSPGIHPSPEKFWITLETQNFLGGANFVEVDGNKYIDIDFVDINRNPYTTADEQERLHIKLIRYVVDSRIPSIVGENSIRKVSVVMVNQPESLVFPDRYVVYFPTTNTLVRQQSMPLDHKVFDTNKIIMLIDLLDSANRF